MQFGRRQPKPELVDSSTPPKGLEIETEPPRGKGSMNPRFRLFMWLVGGLTLFVVLYGITHMTKKPESQAVQQRKQDDNSGQPAKSSRAAIEAQTKPTGFRSLTSAVQNNRPAGQTHPKLGYQANGTGNEATANAGAVPGISPEEKQRLDLEKKMFEEERTARSAPIGQGQSAADAGQPATTSATRGATMHNASFNQTDTNGGSGEETELKAASNPSVVPAAEYGNGVANVLRALNGDGGNGQSSYAAQNGQDDKRSFAHTDAKGSLLTTVRENPISPYMLMQHTNIPCSIDPKLASDLPGEVTAIVRRDVYDSLTGKYVLIPAGTKLIGEYNSNITFGQSRVQVAWSRLIFPDTSSRALGKMMAYSAEGTSGLHDKTNHHIWPLIGSVGLSSALAAGLELSQNRSGANNSVLQYPSAGSVIGAAVGQQASQVGSQIASRHLNRQPTIIIRPGSACVVLANKDIPFDMPYQPHPPQ